MFRVVCWSAMSTAVQSFVSCWTTSPWQVYFQTNTEISMKCSYRYSIVGIKPFVQIDQSTPICDHNYSVERLLETKKNLLRDSCRTASPKQGIWDYHLIQPHQAAKDATEYLGQSQLPYLLYYKLIYKSQVCKWRKHASLWQRKEFIL